MIFVLLLTFIILVHRKSSRDKVLTQIFLGFLNFVIICTLVLQMLYGSSTLFWLTIALALLSFLIAYYYSSVESKWQVYSFYLIFGAFILIYCVHYFSIMPTFL
jgi:multisubunit Na+/H+ antiporter MnhF subunit